MSRVDPARVGCAVGLAAFWVVVLAAIWTVTR